VATQISRRDLPWVALIAVSFALALAVSWERWGNPLVDCGREMNQPLRLARGEALYSDVRHIYGPLSPHLNAALYKIYGPSLAALYADGVVTTIIILALVYWLARQLMGRVQSAAAALTVMCLCALKPSGNYVLPYSYSALHGCALGLVALALLVRAAQLSLDRERPGARFGLKVKAGGGYYLFGAGVIAGLTALAKTEMGLAALVTGVAAAGLIGYPRLKRSLTLGALFIAPAAAVIIAVYAAVIARVGWATLSEESFLFMRNLPAELIYFNKRISGFDAPLDSLIQMLGAALRVAALAAVVAAVSRFAARGRKKHAQAQQVAARDTAVSDAGRASYPQLWTILAALAALLLATPVVSRMQWDKGPYLAMPILLGALLITGLIEFQRRLSGGNKSAGTLVLLIVAAYALASLARVMLRVRSGGAYSSYLLPASVILFTYAWTKSLPCLLRGGRARRLARNIAIGLILFDVVVTAGLLGYRYRTKNTHAISTPRGTIITLPDMGVSFNEAIAFIERETAAGEPVAVMPEGTSLNFLTDRANPLREEITTPGFLDAAGEERAIRRLEETNTRVVMITNRATSEFGPAVFGRDYCTRLMGWIEENFDEVAIFGPEKDPGLQIGDRTFFIRAYLRKQRAAN
jgi:hypothetical protein